jgi:ABC-2 type transport system permease protein
MAEQPQAIKMATESAETSAGDPPRRFPPRGVPLITGINRVGLWSLYLKEVRRFIKVQTQTIWAPAVTTLLFLVIFTVALGGSDRAILGVSFGDFVAPGLIMMAMMQNAFANSSFSFLSGKIQGTIIDLLMPPLSEGELMTGIVAAAITRAVLVGFTVAAAMALYPGVTLHAREPWAIVWFGLMGAILLALMGLVASLWSEKFDHNAAVTNFVIAPLSLLSGTFYTIERLSGVFETVSRFNPFFYVISGFRYGFLGRSDIGGEQAVLVAGAGLLALNALLAWLTYLLLRSGWRIRS